MGSEFESMEEYWEEKMGEERKFHEKQLKSNEKQFEDLEMKMKEYEELLMTVEPKINIDPDRLSTIDEKRSLEEEVNIHQIFLFLCVFHPGQCLGGGDYSTEDQDKNDGRKS